MLVLLLHLRPRRRFVKSEAFEKTTSGITSTAIYHIYNTSNCGCQELMVNGIPEELEIFLMNTVSVCVVEVL